jgi:hypothetical protein
MIALPATVRPRARNGRAATIRKIENGREEKRPCPVLLGEKAATRRPAAERTHQRSFVQGNTMSKYIVAAVAALALSVGFTSVAGATEYKREYCEETKQYWQYKKVVTYKTVIEYKVVKEEVVKYVTEYDDHGKPYQVKKVFFKEVEVPVKKTVPVVTWVKVKVVD